jgi:hypothetical protein
VRADVAGNKRWILILTMSTKPTLSILLLITLTLPLQVQIYAFEPRLRIRLTLCGFTFPSKLIDLLGFLHFIPPPPIMSSKKRGKSEFFEKLSDFPDAIAGRF